MKIFTEINHRIKNHLDGDNKRELHLGHYDIDDFDYEDKKQLRDWIPLGSTLYEKEIAGIIFTFDLVIPEI